MKWVEVFSLTRVNFSVSFWEFLRSSSVSALFVNHTFDKFVPECRRVRSPKGSMAGLLLFHWIHCADRWGYALTLEGWQFVHMALVESRSTWFEFNEEEMFLDGWNENVEVWDNDQLPEGASVSKTWHQLPRGLSVTERAFRSRIFIMGTTMWWERRSSSWTRSPYYSPIWRKPYQNIVLSEYIKRSL